VRTDAAVFAAVRSSRWTLVIAVAAVAGGYAGLLSWDVAHYDWLRGYDAYANSLYSDVIRLHHRLPTTTETDVWHTPPLFFALAALVHSHRAMQFLDGASALAVAVFAGLIARELFPRSRLTQVAALAFAALTPVLTRTAVMYHPEPLAAALAAAGLYVIVRTLERRRHVLRGGSVAGLLFGLAILTRTWAIAPAGACFLGLVLFAWLERELRHVYGAALMVGVVLILTLPWFVHQARAHGSPFAFNRPAPKERFFSRRPASFYLSLDVGAVLSHPYAPNFANHLLPVLYTDWWGDYWRYFDIPYENISSPPSLPPRYEQPRVRQSYVGIAPTLLGVAGFVGVAWAALRRRSPALLVLTLAIVLLGIQFLVFQIAYPHPDGDTIKAAYLLNAVAPLAVCAAYALGWVSRAGRLVTVALLSLLVYAAVLDISFLVLPS
jgi:hypothetical protein